jgi:hypothetical protein
VDQDVLVSERTESGERLIEALSAAGYEISIAFWAKPTDEGKWFLYLVSPFVDEHGPAAAYRLVHRVIRELSGVWIDPFEIRVVGSIDSLAQAALEVTKPKVPDSRFAVRNPRLFPTRLGGTSLGGVSVDGAYIYPTSRPRASV